MICKVVGWIRSIAPPARTATVLQLQINFALQKLRGRGKKPAGRSRVSHFGALSSQLVPPSEPPSQIRVGSLRRCRQLFPVTFHAVDFADQPLDLFDNTLPTVGFAGFHFHFLSASWQLPVAAISSVRRFASK